MFNALYIAATGMQAEQLNVDTIANNLANVNTTGFKKGQVSFTDLMVRQAASMVQPSAESDAGILGTLPNMGVGVGIASISTQFDAGTLKQTGSAYDIAIQGDGFFEVIMPDGKLAYTRGGTLKVSSDGQLVTQAGYPLKPAITIPDNAQSLVIGSDGRVQVNIAGQSGLADIGQLEMARFASPQGLLVQGNNLYTASDASGEAISAKAGEDGIGTIIQGSLEGSNVQMVNEMVNLMIAQRAYEASVKVAQASDEMLGMVNGLRK